MIAYRVYIHMNVSMYLCAVHIHIVAIYSGGVLFLRLLVVLLVLTLASSQRATTATTATAIAAAPQQQHNQTTAQNQFDCLLL